MKPEKEEFKPYISPEQSPPEITVTSVVMGILLAVVFGAANAYLGLRVGMTVSASIPAAVISMGVIRILLKRDSVLECNMVQTIGSAGESLAAGAIFTLPALFLWARDGIMEKPSLMEITLITLCGGILGILFMVPLRKALIVKEHRNLPYPEGTACAEVLLAGEKGGNSATAVFVGMGFGAAVKFVVDGLKVVPGTIAWKWNALKTEVSTEVYPALVGVGYICGPKIASYMMAGGVLGWLVLIPAIVTFGGDTILFPGTVTISELMAEKGASGIWGNYIRYIGAGAVAAGGIISLIKTLPLIFATFREAVKGLKSEPGAQRVEQEQGQPEQGKHRYLGRVQKHGKRTEQYAGIARTEQDMNMRLILAGLILMILAVWWIPVIPVNIIGAVIIVIFGFFFAAVSSRMVGLVGSSNNPVSGMAIATLLIAAFVLKLAGEAGSFGMQGAIAIGSVICIVACMAGDTSQDLKTGFLLGATPRRQQIGEIIGTVFSAVAIGGVLYLLDAAWGFGSQELSAPQATLMKLIVEGVMEGNLPWTLVFIGVFIAVVVEILGVPVLPVAIGLYLPFSLTACIMLGGIVRFLVNKKDKSTVSRGTLFSSGMIAGEGLIGILLAVFAVAGIDQALDVSAFWQTGRVGGVVLLAAIVVFLWGVAIRKKKSC